MLKAEEMVRVSITGPKNLMRPVIEELYRLKVLHIKEHKKTAELDIGNPLETNEKLSELLIKARGIISYLSIDKQAPKKEFSLKEIESTLKEMEAKIEFIRQRDAAEKLASLNSKLSLLLTLKKLPLKLQDYSEYRNLEIFVGFAKELVKIKKEIKNKRFEFFESEQLFALFIEKEKAKEAYEILKKNNFTELDLISVREYFNKGFDEAINTLNQETGKLKKRIKNVSKAKERLKNAYSEFLNHAENFLSKETKKAEAPLTFAITGYTFTAEGWLPKKRFNEVKNALEKRAHSKVNIDLEKTEIAPVKLEHPKFIKPFMFFLDLYTIPRYGEIDPTFFLFLTFPIFFGFMLGDIGYGLISLIIFLILRAKFPKGKQLFNILIISALATMVFGFAFGEFFGAESILGFELPRLISRAHNFNQLLIISIIIGAIHINTGLLVGFYNVMKEHNLKAAIMEKFSWILLQAGGALLFFVKEQKWAFYLGIVIILAAVAMRFLAGGVMGIIEIPTLASNLLSYARLMAVGLASVSLAMMINELSFELFRSGIMGILIGTLIIIMGQGINFLLGILTPFLHSLRLHYIEFFGKFYKGGGQRYAPFGE